MGSLFVALQLCCVSGDFAGDGMDARTLVAREHALVRGGGLHRSQLPFFADDFFDDDVDDDLICELLWGLALVDWQAVKRDDLPIALGEPDPHPLERDGEVAELVAAAVPHRLVEIAARNPVRRAL